VRGPLLERYEILGELGQGGMSVVYRARDRQLAREVALKVLHEFLARQPDARKRFHREAVAVAKLHHPGILEIFDYSGPDAEDTYIVTELIDGETLRDYIEARGRLAYPEMAVLVVVELVRALRHAHEQSIIHRDLKPENVMITKDGVLKLMDFGLAQMMDGGTKLTATGTLLGSPAHMAPEVIDGKTSDARSDIFSVGTILYWLTTGKLPFEAPNPSALFKKILDGKYDDPQMTEPKVGNQLARIIKKSLEANIDERYQDVTEVYADLVKELQLVDITEPDVEVRKVLRDPAAYAIEVGPKLIASLTLRGKEALKEGHLARAMDRFNRVLAIDPAHEEVRRLVAKVGRRRALARRLKQASAMAITGSLLGAVAYGAVAYVPALVETMSRASAEKEHIVAKTPAPMPAPPVERSIIETDPRQDVQPPTRIDRPRSLAKVALAKREPAKVEEKKAEPAKGGEPAAPQEPKLFPLNMVATNGFALRFLVDGHPIGEGMLAECMVPAGMHLVEMTTATGNQTKTVEVDERGAIFDIDPDGQRHRVVEKRGVAFTVKPN
jgi:serine/threonine-protein kinase